MCYIYILTVLFMYTGLLLYPKSERPLNLPSWCILTLISVMGIQTAAGIVIYHIAGAKVTMLNVGMFNMIADIIIWFMTVIHYRSFQKYDKDLLGWAIIAFLSICAILVGMWRFGPSLNLFSYCSADSGEHLRRIESIIAGGELSENRCFLYINEALFMESFGPLLTPMNYYRVFIAYDLFMWVLGGGILYVLLRPMMNTRFNYITGIGFILLYFFGYPLNNLLYGYEYLGMTVTLAGYVLYVSVTFGSREIRRYLSVLMLLLGILSAALAYTQFMPVILAGAVIYTTACIIKEGRRTGYLKAGLLLFTYFIIGIFSVYFIIFRGFGTLEDMFSVMTKEANIYRELWANSFYFLPFFVLYLYDCIKCKKLDEAYCYLIPAFIYIGYFLVRVISGQTASYYFYKFHFILWLYILFSAFKGIFLYGEKYKKALIAYAAGVVIIAVISVCGLEQKIGSSHPLWNVETSADDYLDIYSFNLSRIINKTGNMDIKKQELFYAVAGYVYETGTLVPYIGEWEEYWMNYYYSITNQWDYWAYFFYRTDELSETKWDVLEYFQKNVYDLFDVRYIMVQRNSPAYWYGIGYFSTLEAVYENEYGFIYRR